MLQIRKLTLIHKKDLHVLLRDFELVLNAGDKAVVIGEEGNGKSTLLRWICDPALVEPYVEAEGERVCRGKLAYLPQELTEEEKQGSVYAYFSRFDAFWDTGSGELRRIARELGLEKKPGFLQERRRDIQRLAGDAIRRSDHKNTRFKKGVHYNPAGEFKPGHVESPETKAKRSESLKYAWKVRKAKIELDKNLHPEKYF